MEVQERRLLSPTAGRLIPGSITLRRRPVGVNIEGMGVVTVGCIGGGDRGWWVDRGIFGLLARSQFWIYKWFLVCGQKLSSPGVREGKGREYRVPALAEADGKVVEDR